MSNLLPNQGFVTEISLLIDPVISGNKSFNVFSNVNRKVKLKLSKKEILDKEYLWLMYILRNNPSLLVINYYYASRIMTMANLIEKFLQ